MYKWYSKINKNNIDDTATNNHEYDHHDRDDYYVLFQKNPIYALQDNTLQWFCTHGSSSIFFFFFLYVLLWDNLCPI